MNSIKQEGLNFSQLAGMCSTKNVILRRGKETGILISIMDMEKSRNVLSVVSEGEWVHWPIEGTEFVEVRDRA